MEVLTWLQTICLQGLSECGGLRVGASRLTCCLGVCRCLTAAQSVCRCQQPSRHQQGFQHPAPHQQRLQAGRAKRPGHRSMGMVLPLRLPRGCPCRGLTVSQPNPNDYFCHGLTGRHCPTPVAKPVSKHVAAHAHWLQAAAAALAVVSTRTRTVCLAT